MVVVDSTWAVSDGSWHAYLYNCGECGHGSVGENVKFCRGEQRRFFDAVRRCQAGWHIAWQTSCCEVEGRQEPAGPMFLLAPRGSEEWLWVVSRKERAIHWIESGGNYAEHLSKRLRRVDCFRRWSWQRVIRKTPSLTKDFRRVLKDLFVFRVGKQCVDSRRGGERLQRWQTA